MKRNAAGNATKTGASGPVVGRGGRIDTTTLRMPEVTQAFELLHSSEPDSDVQLLKMIEGEQI